MPSDAWSPTPAKPDNSLESLKETFKQKLDAILNKQLTIENIETFADEALERLTLLTKEILEQYGTNEALEPANLAQNTREQEDDAFKKLDLPNIQEILGRVIEVKGKIDSIKTYLGAPKEKKNEVIIPPQHDSTSEIRVGSGQGIEDKKFIPRLLTLLYILEADFDIKKEQIKITEGKTTPEMMRKTPYVRVEISDLERIVYICDEEGNASYVFDAGKLEEAGIQIENIDVSDKSAINDLITKHAGIGSRIIQTKHWRSNMTELLGNSIPEKAQEESSIATEISDKPVSEFESKERKKFLSFEDFQKEVRNLCNDGEVNVFEWYRKERENHKNWPHSPQETYKHMGWVGYSELVGKENYKKREFLSFKDFEAEVINLYPKKGDVANWYRKEKKNHKNWPSNPETIYEGTGWVGWSELVGRDNFLKKEFLSFKDFQTEVANLYPGKGDVTKWYRKERENHKNWPSEPWVVYRGKGWLNWQKILENKRESNS